MFERRLLQINDKFRIFVEGSLHGNMMNTLDIYLLGNNSLFVTNFAHSPSLEGYQFLPRSVLVLSVVVIVAVAVFTGIHTSLVRVFRKYRRIQMYPASKCFYKPNYVDKVSSSPYNLRKLGI